MKLVILCGGQGTRFREETEFRPKPMIEIGGRPILWHIMKLYTHHNVTDFVLCLGYKGYAIKEFFLNYEMRTKDFTVRLGHQQSVMFHTNHAESGWSVTLAETGETAMTGARLRRVGKYLDEPTFCLTYGDGLGDVNIKELIQFHQAHGKLATVTGVRPPGRFGELQVDGRQVRAFAEKPQVTEGLINGGFFVLQREFVDRYLDDRDDLSLESEPLQRLAADGELMVWPHRGFWQPMDTYREWKLLEELWQMGRAPWKVWE
ncbi:MAG: glucose-1-phosphate cytidylyltransferase [Candidatus Entotheonella factor]|uniref:Glucose-1-phosphate cytidylyltransferase n=1 Tax=Entotheonella factor TaxID=1429438 RepID=W4L9Z7_ENTF1|nr:glucose-1-phosphate cytidylyltransferase [Candidatus Entotheonella palauensis]ETW94734.1 MAG: glucose-1-phosphate cytidylyltransferase [Candidatus Entotheonella factor]